MWNEKIEIENTFICGNNDAKKLQQKYEIVEHASHQRKTFIAQHYATVVLLLEAWAKTSTSFSFFMFKYQSVIGV